MASIKELINSLKSMELPKGAESLLSSIAGEATSLESDRDDLRGKVQTRQTENDKLKTRAQTAETRITELEGKVPDEKAVILSSQDASEFEAFKALGLSAKDLKTKLEQAATDHQTAVSAGNEKALSMRGLSPDVLELKKFDGAIFKSEKVGDKVKTTVTQDDKELDFEVWQKEKNLEGTLKNFVVQGSGVPVLGQVQGDRSESDPTKQTRDTSFKI